LDAPGTLQHIMGRGIERTKIFRNKRDREEFLTRLAALCEDGSLIVYAWALMPNHFHSGQNRESAFISKHAEIAHWLCCEF
jgi:REP element-mobilizing transposase RayT